MNSYSKKIIEEGLKEYYESGISFDSLENSSDMILERVLFYGGPNHFAKNNYKKSKKWEIGISSGFYETLDALNLKERAKLFSIFQKITKNPITPLGNTIKPLSGNYKELWRYRMGNWRIIYKPVLEMNHILLLYLRHRSKAYR